MLAYIICRSAHVVGQHPYIKFSITLQIAKEDFDTKAKALLGEGNINLHNEFLFAILVKCQTGLQPTAGRQLNSLSHSEVYLSLSPPDPHPVAVNEVAQRPHSTTPTSLPPPPPPPPPPFTTAPPPPPPLTSSKPRPKRQRLASPHLEPIPYAALDPLHYLSPAKVLSPSLSLSPSPRPLPLPLPPSLYLSLSFLSCPLQVQVVSSDLDTLLLCSHELLLPDHPTLHTRMLLGAWEAGLGNVSHDAVDLLQLALEV